MAELDNTVMPAMLFNDVDIDDKTAAGEESAAVKYLCASILIDPKLTDVINTFTLSCEPKA